MKGIRLINKLLKCSNTNHQPTFIVLPRKYGTVSAAVSRHDGCTVIRRKMLGALLQQSEILAAECKEEALCEWTWIG